MKNNKLLCRGRLITNPKRQQWMDQCVKAFVSQLNCSTAIGGGATLMEPQQRSLTASLPQDDCWSEIPELHVMARLVPKGDEGAIVSIERL